MFGLLPARPAVGVVAQLTRTRIDLGCMSAAETRGEAVIVVLT